MNKKEKQVYDLAVKAYRVGTLRKRIPSEWSEEQAANYYLQRYRESESLKTTPKWAVQLGDKIDNFVGEVTKFVTVSNTIRKMNANRLATSIKRQKYYGAPKPFSSSLFGIGTCELIKSNDHTRGGYTLYKNSILSELTSLGIEAYKRGIYDEYKKALSQIIQRLKGNREDTIYDALANFVKLFKEKIEDVNPQLERLSVNENGIAQEIGVIVGQIHSSAKDREI